LTISAGAIFWHRRFPIDTDRSETLMFAARLGSALKNLMLALLNATLILILLCLFVAWRLAAEVNAITDDVAQNIVSAVPARDELQDLTAEVAGLRAELATSAQQGGAISTEAVQRLDARAEDLDARFAGLSERAQAMSDDPGVIIDRAVGAVIDKLSAEAQVLMECRAADPI
jgi:hypothetical protein